ncbi:twin-arginine translocase TatA/TatE family subunit [Desulfofalx alkaliphila]|uniref:twin-arginine translocase TatA/TatE family subunit n=1 Tax=Desulfofalx alkaliphila TaxID=105483 RepID=UPI0004E1E624|nr:twin-arginine translocase TatA/TatE family subunit [Desulfofalx alkaliphila]
MGTGLLQPMHILLILIVVLIIFGPGKLPDVGKAIGKSIREFKSATAGDDPKKDDPQKAEAKPNKDTDVTDTK